MHHQLQSELRNVGYNRGMVGAMKETHHLFEFMPLLSPYKFLSLDSPLDLTILSGYYLSHHGLLCCKNWGQNRVLLNRNCGNAKSPKAIKFEEIIHSRLMEIESANPKKAGEETQIPPLAHAMLVATIKWDLFFTHLQVPLTVSKPSQRVRTILVTVVMSRSIITSWSFT